MRRGHGGREAPAPTPPALKTTWTPSILTAVLVCVCVCVIVPAHWMGDRGCSAPARLHGYPPLGEHHPTVAAAPRGVPSTLPPLPPPLFQALVNDDKGNVKCKTKESLNALSLPPSSLLYYLSFSMFFVGFQTQTGQTATVTATWKDFSLPRLKKKRSAKLVSGGGSLAKS